MDRFPGIIFGFMAVTGAALLLIKSINRYEGVLWIY